MSLLAVAATCEVDATVCTWVLDLTGSDVLARIVDAVIEPLASVLAILLVTLIVSLAARRLVLRLARQAKQSRVGDRLNSLMPGGRRLVPVDPRRHQRLDSVTAAVASIVVVAVWVIGGMIALGAFDINLAPLIASAGIVGVALGFGAQSLVKDFLTGMFMLAEDQFGIGDIVDIGEAIGEVEAISLRTTSVRATDGTLWHVPNGEIQRVGNMSQDWSRTLLDVGIAYGSDIDQAIAVITTVCRDLAGDKGHDQVILEEPSILGVEQLAADSVVIRLWIKTLPGEQWTIARELRRRLKLALDDAGIELPYPQRTVWLRHADEPNAPSDDPSGN